MRTLTHYLLLLSLCTGVSGVALAAPGNPDRGQGIFMQRCALCHGQDGRGNQGMAVNFREEWHRLTQPDQVIMNNIRNGLRSPGKSYSAGMMPPQVLNDRDMQDVLAYIKRTFLH